MGRSSPEEETSAMLCDAIGKEIDAADALGNTLVAALLMQAGAAAGCLTDEAAFP